MTALRITRGCLVAGQPLAAGHEYAVPSEVSDDHALLLVRIGKAEFVEPAAERSGPPPQKRPQAPSGRSKNKAHE